MTAVRFKDVWEMYQIKFMMGGKACWEKFWALKGISFDVEKGEILGIIGENGAGKSTILKLIAGMLSPDRGEVKVLGRIAGLLELGAGFQAELTGTENIFLNAGLFGLSQAQVQEKYEAIVDFANLGKFIHAPVKCYSQGMFVRLAFAIAIHIDPDILLIDDTLAVGDEYFQRKCMAKIFEIKEQGKTIIFVSHDMHALSRLCPRALFLKEGRIVADNTTDKVMPLYTQMIGTKEGAGILTKDFVNLVFNNGRFFLNWRDQLLTPHSGAYTVFLINNKWYTSLAADWQVERSGEDRLVAIGRHPQVGLTQVWRLELSDARAVKWDIDLELEESCEIQEGYANMMLTDQYAQWFTSYEKGEFPQIREDYKNWQTLLEGPILRKCIGVRAAEGSGKKIPSLVFEQTNFLHRSQAQISNTDYPLSSRVLQYKLSASPDHASAQARRFAYFSARVLLDVPDLDGYLRDFQEDFVLAEGPLRLAFDNGRGMLSSNGIDLTKAPHMGTSLFANGRRYSSSGAHWEFKKEKKNQLIARGVWPGLPLVQTWKIELKDGASFSWEVALEVKEKVSIEEQSLSLMFSEKYKKWFCEYGQGSFPDTFLEDRADMFQRCIPDGSFGLESSDTGLPAVVLTFSGALNNFSKIFNSDFYSKARTLEVQRVEPEAQTIFLPGRHACFKIEGRLPEKTETPVVSGAGESQLQNGKCKFIFDKGGGRIYWEDIELTKKLGLYTSLRSQGRWHDSVSCALWKIEEKTKDTVKASGKWLHLPLQQHWEMRMKEKNMIEFIVNLIVDEPVEVDRLQTNLMLLEKYSLWFNDREKGSFPVFKEDIDDDWDCLSAEAATTSIGVLDRPDNHGLPSVKLCPFELNSQGRLLIANSDICHRGRILQYLNASSLLLSAGEYPYFRGEIVIES